MSLRTELYESLDRCTELYLRCIIVGVKINLYVARHKDYENGYKLKAENTEDKESITKMFHETLSAITRLDSSEM